MSTQRREERKGATRARIWPPFPLCSVCAIALKTITVALLALVGAGCGGQNIKTHRVTGKVEVKDGEVAMLAGSSVELKHETDEGLRPYGNIDASGNFSLKTQYKGQLVEGAPEGNYKARIILGDESDEGVPKRKGKGNPIHPRFFNFQTSGLTFKVPGSDYTVSLSRK